MITVRNLNKKLGDALAKVEAAVETPFVPGELERWMDAVEEAFLTLEPVLEKQLNQIHPDIYDDIQQEDPGLLPRVELMQSQDQEIKRADNEIKQKLPILRNAITNIEPDEAIIKRTLESFVDETLEFVITIRKQEQSLRTWTMEAFNRDRGTVD